MINISQNLKPENVWKHFVEITKVPHGSGNEEKVRDYIVNFVKNNSELELRSAPDDRDVIVYRKSSAGMEDKPIMVLQAHMDMVLKPEKMEFPLKLVECDENGNEGKGWLKAGGYTEKDGTTLGADDGIGVAIALAILEDTEHKFGAIECLFTVEEETTMVGAKEFNKDLIKGRAFINLDSEDAEFITYGSAGGQNSTYTWSANKIETNKDADCFELKISGLKGGHSGADIEKGRANAIKLMARLLYEIRNNNIQFNIATFTGGERTNIIPGKSNAIVAVNKEDSDKFVNLAQMIYTGLKKEYSEKVEPNLKFECTSYMQDVEVVYDSNSTQKLLNILMAIPHGILKMQVANSMMVETSTNLAQLSTRIGTKEDTYTLTCLHRSSEESGVDWVIGIHKAIAELAGVKIIQNQDDRFPAWEPNEKSELLAKAKRIYEKKYGNKYKVETIHAGLECSLIVEKYKGEYVDCISIGPTAKEVHTVRERINIESVDDCYECVVKLLTL